MFRLKIHTKFALGKGICIMFFFFFSFFFKAEINAIFSSKEFTDRKIHATFILKKFKMQQ